MALSYGWDDSVNFHLVEWWVHAGRTVRERFVIETLAAATGQQGFGGANRRISANIGSSKGV